jgi:hypothetical protein
MNLSGKIVITFNDVFPGEISLTVEEYLDGIDKDTLKKFSAFILVFSKSKK